MDPRKDPALDPDPSKVTRREALSKALKAGTSPQPPREFSTLVEAAGETVQRGYVIRPVLREQLAAEDRERQARSLDENIRLRMEECSDCVAEGREDTSAHC